MLVAFHLYLLAMSIIFVLQVPLSLDKTVVADVPLTGCSIVVSFCKTSAAAKKLSKPPTKNTHCVTLLTTAYSGPAIMLVCMSNRMLYMAMAGR